MNKLHYFCTVAQAGSITKASELLNISQPALSKAIKSLEAEIGQQLVQASGRGIAITDYGHQLFKKASPLLKQFQSLYTEEKEDEKTILKIASFEVFSTYFISRLLKNYMPETSIETLELIPGQMEEAVRSGAADIAITYLPIPSSDLDILKVASFEMNIYGLSKFAGYSFLDLPFVAPNSPLSYMPSKVSGLDGWPDHKAPRSIAHKAHLLETALELARDGIGVGYFPKFIVDLQNEKLKAKHQIKAIHKKSTPKNNKQDIYLIKRKSDLESAYFKKIARALRMETK